MNNSFPVSLFSLYHGKKVGKRELVKVKYYIKNKNIYRPYRTSQRIMNLADSLLESSDEDLKEEELEKCPVEKERRRNSPYSLDFCTLISIDPLFIDNYDFSNIEEDLDDANIYDNSEFLEFLTNDDSPGEDYTMNTNSKNMIYKTKTISKIDNGHQKKEKKMSLRHDKHVENQDIKSNPEKTKNVQKVSCNEHWMEYRNQKYRSLYLMEITKIMTVLEIDKKTNTYQYSPINLQKINQLLRKINMISWEIYSGDSNNIEDEMIHYQLDMWLKYYMFEIFNISEKEFEIRMKCYCSSTDKSKVYQRPAHIYSIIDFVEKTKNIDGEIVEKWTHHPKKCVTIKAGYKAAARIILKIISEDK